MTSLINFKEVACFNIINKNQKKKGYISMDKILIYDKTLTHWINN
jgi:hypothetical protein